MLYRRERKFLKSLCKDHIQDLLEDVGWTPLQCSIVRKRYLEFKFVAKICIELGLSESQHSKLYINICEKLHSYLVHNKEIELYLLYEKT